MNLNYKNFFDAFREKIYFNYNGTISIQDLFDLDIEELKQLYIKHKKKVSDENDPLLQELGNEIDKREILKFEIIRDILIYKKEAAKKNQLLARKRELQRMLNEIKLKQLEQDPTALEEEIKKLDDELEN